MAAEREALQKARDALAHGVTVPASSAATVSVGQNKPVPDHTPMESSGGER